MLILEDDVVGLLRLLFLQCLVSTSNFDSVTLGLRLFDYFYTNGSLFDL